MVEIPPNATSTTVCYLNADEVTALTNRRPNRSGWLGRSIMRELNLVPCQPDPQWHSLTA